MHLDTAGKIIGHSFPESLERAFSQVNQEFGVRREEWVEDFSK
jgi:hypothetical protein